MGAAEIAALLAALGVGGIIPTLIEGLTKWVTGRQDAEREHIREAHTAANLAQRARDSEAAKRRIISEYASTLRILLINSGVPSADIPPWPTITREDTP